MRNAENLNAVARVVAGVQTSLQVKQLDDLLDWISPLNVPYRQSYLNAWNKRYKGTGDWILKTPKYEEWVSKTEPSSICLSGVAGSGKTVLSAVVLHDLQTRLSNEDLTPCILYYYFDMRDAYKNTTAGFYDSLVRQLLHYYPLGYAEVLELAKKTHRVHPTSEEYVELIKELVGRVLTTGDIFFVVDGCDPEECTDFLALRDTLFGIKSVSGSNRDSEATTLVDQPPAVLANAELSEEPIQVQKNRGCLKMFITTRSHTRTQQLCDIKLSISHYPIIRDIRRFVHGQIYSMPEPAKTAIGNDLLKKAVDVIGGQSNQLFIQAKLHVDTILRQETVEDVEQALSRLPSQGHEAYAGILHGIIERYPKDRDQEVLRRMFVWLCQAKYCLPVSEFAAVTTLEIDTAANSINKKPIPWDPEAFCQRLGPLLNIDHRPSPPEINLPHATAEEYLQGPHIRADPTLRTFAVYPRKAQKYLAEFCIRFLACAEFCTPLTTQPMKDNPFKCIPGGLGCALDRKKHEWIGPMVDRLNAHHGLEYAAINWHHHLKNAARGKNTVWIRDTIVPLLGWFFDEKDPRYRSWCEAHAYFCHELKTDCGCEKWQGPKYFLERFGLGFLEGYIKGSERSVPDVEEDDE
ncbi:hypothetical protein B0H63DRAFT_437505, partial [Podospora didyma]